MAEMSKAMCQIVNWMPHAGANSATVWARYGRCGPLRGVFWSHSIRYNVSSRHNNGRRRQRGRE